MPSDTSWPRVGRYFEAPKKWEYPEHWDPEPFIFLAGGITNCENWQQRACDLVDPRWTVFNPRRDHYDMTNPDEAEVQIRWEFEFLNRADVILFWFAGGESPQPITLYEYGRHLALAKKRIVVGVDDRYVRRQDVIIQTKLARPHRTPTIHSQLASAVAEANAFLPPWDPREYEAVFGHA